MKAIAGLVCAAMLGGCSFGMTRVEPTWDGSSALVCTDDYRGVAADTFFGGFALGVGLAASDSSGRSSDTIAPAGLIVGLLLGIDAVLADKVVRDCRSAQARARRMAVSRRDRRASD
jgi:hypothetical protein